VNKARNSEQFDTDILRCKADIIRARNIIPPDDGTAPKNSAMQNNPDTAELSTHNNTGSIPIETIPAGYATGKETAPLPRPAESVNKKEQAEETPEIPSFDLAGEIMAEQRRITAIRRRAPGGKTDVQRLKPEVQPVEHIIEEPKSALSESRKGYLTEQEKIIAEIVARDIEWLCRGDYSANNK
jgi:hypothetical protein